MMAQDSKTAFQWRAFISTLTGLSFVAMCITGIILFVVPPGRVANWTGWTLYGLTKAQWQALHIWFSVLFMLAAIVHIVYNWQCLLRYCQSKVTKAFTLRRVEPVAAALRGAAGCHAGELAAVLVAG